MWWIMAAGSAVILLLVTALVLIALFKREVSQRAHMLNFIYVGGILFPVVTLTALLLYTLMVSNRLTSAAAGEVLRIEVVARQWWWEVRYPADQGDAGFITANELHVPVGRSVEIHISSPDVIHSFWVPNLAGKVDAIPGRVNRLRFRAEKSGIYRGQCAEFCGLQHALMSFHVVAEEAEGYEAWRRRESAPARPPIIPVLRNGHDVFIRSGCGACHTIRGTDADGKAGPDLTHVGGRQALAAGTLTNNVGSLAGWIAAADHIKKGNGMPSFNVLSGPELRDLAAWLESLK